MEDWLDAQKQDSGPSSLTGQVLDGRYKMGPMIGQGHASRVYEAEHLLLKRIVAIKILQPELIEEEQALERFKLEARAISQLDHHNIVKVYDSGVADGEPYIVMENVGGKTLARFLERNGPLSRQQAITSYSQKLWTD